MGAVQPALVTPTPTAGAGRYRTRTARGAKARGCELRRGIPPSIRRARVPGQPTGRHLLPSSRPRRLRRWALRSQHPRCIDCSSLCAGIHWIAAAERQPAAARARARGAVRLLTGATSNNPSIQRRINSAQWQPAQKWGQEPACRPASRISSSTRAMRKTVGVEAKKHARRILDSAVGRRTAGFASGSMSRGAAESHAARPQNIPAPPRCNEHAHTRTGNIARRSPPPPPHPPG
jgi:hypothetical protein